VWYLDVPHHDPDSNYPELIARQVFGAKGAYRDKCSVQ
jgi:hypothetical protein